MNYTLTLDREKFTKLINIIKLFENDCTDCDIQNGKIRQRTNDRQLVINVDASSILTNYDFSLSDIKNKSQLLKAYELDDNIQLENKNIIIESNDSNYEITDPLSKLVLRKPSGTHIDNKYIADDEFAKMVECKEESLLFSTVISNYLKRRFSNISTLFNNDLIRCDVLDLTAKIFIVSGDKQNNCDVQQTIQLNKSMKHGNFAMLTVPFVLDIASDIKISCYLIGETSILCKYEQTYFGVPITLYQRSKLTVS